MSILFKRTITFNHKLYVTLFLIVSTTIGVLCLYYSEIQLIWNYSKINENKTSSSNVSHGEWHNVSTKNFRIFVYSAFYDDRPSLLSAPVIRIIAISDDADDLKKNNIRLYCVLYHETNHIVVPMKERPLPVGFGWPLNNKKAIEYVYTCPTDNGRIPDAVSIATMHIHHVNASCVPVTVPKKPKTKQNFCICMQVAFGTIDPYRMIEWFELQKILGINLVGIYDLSLSETSLKVLRHYSEEGLVDLRKTIPIYPHEDRHYLLQGSPVINDCMYRHMHEFQWIVVIDFDEFIMPRKHKNLQELLTYLDQINTKKEYPIVNYSFRNNYFFLDLPPDESISPNFTVLRFRKKVEVSPDGYSVKSIINPQACKQMHNHYCWSVTASYTPYEITESVSPNIALNQHYKKCHLAKEQCKNMMKNITEDKITMQFSNILIKRVQNKIKEIMV